LQIISTVAGNSYYANTENIFLELGIIKFKNVNAYLMGLFAYKSIFKILPQSVQNYFTKTAVVHKHFTTASGSLSVQY